MLRLSLTTLTLMVLAGSAWAVEQTLMTIGTGDIMGVYYGAGGAICRLVNKNLDRHGVRCLIESTEGSVANLQALRKRTLDLGIVQSDWQQHAYQGTGRFQSQGPFEELRAMLSLHDESFTVVARAGSGITTFNHLKGKRVNIGTPGSGQRATMDVLLQAKGWTLDDFAQVLELKPTDQARALCNNEVDAIVFTVGHPNNSIFEATTACDSVLVSVSGAEINQLVQDNAYYVLTTIPGGVYRRNANDVSTFGVKAILATSSATSDHRVSTTVEAIFENLATFRRMHPALGALEPQAMVKEGISIPLHPAAVRYYQRQHLLEASSSD